MLVYKPSFYDEFKCIASSCSDSCCIGWEIDIDRKTLDFYKKQTGSFGERLKNNISLEPNSHFIVDANDRCPFLNQNNLCDIILTLGEEHICEICDQHPRFHSWYGSYKESGVGLCCEEAVRLLLQWDMKFVSQVTQEKDDDEEYDSDLFDALMKVRQKSFEILTDNAINFGEKLRLILSMTQDVQDCIDFGDIESIYDCCDDISDGELETDMDRKSAVSSIVELLNEQEKINSQWEGKAAVIKGKLFSDGDLFSNMSLESQHAYNALACYLTFRYFLKAVRDEDIISKMALVCLFCVSLRTLEKAQEDSLAENIRLLSKQFEYSLFNIELIEKACNDGELFCALNAIL